MKERISIDTELSGFTLLEVLWENRLGRLYKAIDQDSSRTVSIQTFHASVLETPITLEALSAHIASLATLKHPNIVETHSLQISDTGPFIVQDYVPGVRLDQYLRSKGTVPWQLALRITRQLLNALKYAHDGHFIHNRLNPGHIVISRGNTAKILQFGVEHLLSGNSYNLPVRLLDNPLTVYTAPEHYEDGSAGYFTSDMYSLGMIVYELLTGAHPLEEANPSFQGHYPFISERTRFLETVIPRPPETLIKTINSAMARNPMHRPQSAEMMIDSLEEIEVETVQPTVIYHETSRIARLFSWLFSRRVILSGLAVLVLGVAAMYVIDKTQRNPFLAMGPVSQPAVVNLNNTVPLQIRALDERNQSVRGEIFINGDAANAYTPTTIPVPVGGNTVEIRANGIKPMEVPFQIRVDADRTKPIIIYVERTE